MPTPHNGVAPQGRLFLARGQRLAVFTSLNLAGYPAESAARYVVSVPNTSGSQRDLRCAKRIRRARLANKSARLLFV